LQRQAALSDESDRCALRTRCRLACLLRRWLTRQRRRLLCGGSLRLVGGDGRRGGRGGSGGRRWGVRVPCARVGDRGGGTAWRGRRRSCRRFVASCAARRRACRARRGFSSVMTVRRPPSRPRARAAFKPACVRSRISWRSTSAIAPKMWNTSRPEEVVVSMPSVRLRNPSCRRSSSAINSMRCRSERPRRSRRHTTRVSSRRATPQAPA
jgi:hypothetical protein